MIANMAISVPCAYLKPQVPGESRQQDLLNYVPWRELWPLQLACNC